MPDNLRCLFRHNCLDFVHYVRYVSAFGKSKHNNNNDIPATPFEALPMLEVDGVKIAQTQAILRYIAREFGEEIHYFESGNLGRQYVQYLQVPTNCAVELELREPEPSLM